MHIFVRSLSVNDRIELFRRYGPELLEVIPCKYPPLALVTWKHTNVVKRVYKTWNWTHKERTRACMNACTLHVGRNPKQKQQAGVRIVDYGKLLKRGKNRDQMKKDTRGKNIQEKKGHKVSPKKIVWVHKSRSKSHIPLLRYLLLH